MPPPPGPGTTGAASELGMPPSSRQSRNLTNVLTDR